MIPQRRYQSLLAGMLAVVFVMLVSACTAFSENLWQIGTFNTSSQEFNHGQDGPPLFGQRFPQGELIYVVGKSTPEKDWPAFQPGSPVGTEGVAAHPYTIEFDLADVPRGLVTLKVSLLIETSRAPHLGVEINGHRAMFYQHPEPDYNGGDRELVVNPIAASDTILAEINPAFLVKGPNKLVLTAVVEPGEGDHPSYGGIYYDAIALEHNSDARFNPGLVSAEVTPTIFYEHKGDGLAELVDVAVRSNRSLVGR